MQNILLSGNLFTKIEIYLIDKLWLTLVILNIYCGLQASKIQRNIQYVFKTSRNGTSTLVHRI